MFDYMGVKEWWATYESCTGLRYWALKLAQNEKPYPQAQHELGGGRIYYNTRDDWERFVKPECLKKSWVSVLFRRSFSPRPRQSKLQRR